MSQANQAALDIIYNDARTFNVFTDKPVEDALLQQAYDLAKMAPTAANTQPLRIYFVKSAEAKEKLKPSLDKGNLDKTMKAPVTAIIAYDLAFYNHLPTLFPHTDAKSWYVGNDKLIQETAFRNGTLGGAYFLLAARSLGLDCGPMSGFDNAKVDDAFFSGTQIKSNFLINLGYGDKDSLHPRSPRPDFAEFCKIL